MKRKLYKQKCEQCGASFKDEAEYYDLCPTCVGPYEEALHDAQLQELKQIGEVRTLRVPFPDGDT
jgi:Zn finger protein HypA/HybF involved in hydrogenase expression